MSIKFKTFISNLNEFQLIESSFVSNSLSTGSSNGVEFDVKKNKEKSVGEHLNGQAKEHHDVYHDGKHVGYVDTYSGYADKKSPNSRIVSSRKNVRLWSTTINAGEHIREKSFNSIPSDRQYSETGMKTKKDALQHLANWHKSNKNK